MIDTDVTRGPLHAPLTRRGLLALALGLSLGASPVPVLPAVAATSPAASSAPGTWRTWLLLSGDELRPAAPPPRGADELTALLARQRERTAESVAAIGRWDDPTIVLPWTNLALDLIRVDQLSPVKAARALALLHVALYDTLVATSDARASFPRPAPGAVDRLIVPLGNDPGDLNSFPDQHAAVATAATTVLSHLFPSESAEALDVLADEVAASRLLAGRAFPSDVAAGQTLGRAVAERAIARGLADGSDRVWDGSGRLSGPGAWEPTPPGYFQQPVSPLAGSWQPWVLASGDQYRPAPPPAYGSPAWRAELAAVQEAVARRTPAQEEAVLYWAGGPGTVTPAGLWSEIARELIVRNALDAPHAARVLALTSVAMADGFICCWDAKYSYWTARPITADPTLDVLIPTPPFPSYTSGHSTISAAAATVLAHLFPAEENALLAWAVEAKQSRLWAGIHFPIDNEMGALGGGMIGRLVVARARADGAEESEGASTGD